MINVKNMSKNDEDISLLLNLDNHKWSYLCECGTASLLSPAHINTIAAIFVSHTHIDHFINFDTILRHQLGTGRTIVLCGPEGISGHIRGKLSGYVWNLVEENSVHYEVREITGDTIEVYLFSPPDWRGIKKETIHTPNRLLYENSSFSVTYTLLDHKIPSAAYLFSEKDTVKIADFPFKPGPWIKQLKEAYQHNQGSLKIEVEGKTCQARELFSYLYVEKGEKTGIIMDHLASAENHKKIKDLFYKADRVYIECYYRDCDRDLALKHYHSTALLSGKICREAGIKEVHPVHFSRRYNQETPEVAAECLAEFENRSS